MFFAFIAWMNFILFNLCSIFCWYYYILSLMPAHRAEQIGERAWDDCKHFRQRSGYFAVPMILFYILWIIVPIPSLAMVVHPNWLLPFFSGLAIAVPGTAIMIKGVKDAGKETLSPSKDTEMYGGVYRYIRHPQMLGEMPWFIVIALWLNSLFLLVYSIAYLLILVPVILYYEEKDLVKRFGNSYVQYQKTTGALIPKFWKRKKKDST